MRYLRTNCEECFHEHYFSTRQPIGTNYTASLREFCKKCDRNKLLANFRACAANHYVIVEKCPYAMPNLAIVDFTDRRLHRIEKCRNAPGNAHGIAENRHLTF